MKMHGILFVSEFYLHIKMWRNNLNGWNRIGNYLKSCLKFYSIRLKEKLFFKIICSLKNKLRVDLSAY